jgi:hypothetical protein
MPYSIKIERTGFRINGFNGTIGDSTGHGGSMAVIESLWPLIALLTLRRRFFDVFVFLSLHS